MSTPGQNSAVVKAVLSGDTLIVMGAPQNGPPPEKQITLSGIIAPRLGRRDGQSKDEPFAWPAREFLRKACVGKGVTFELEEFVASIGKSFGRVYLNGQDVGAMIVSAGWAKVKPAVGNNVAKNAYIDELLQLEQAAQAQSLGMWSKETNASALSIRNILVPGDGGYDAKDVLEAFKGQSIPLVIEQFRDGATLRGYLLPSFHWVTIFLSGISCPGFKRAEDPSLPDTAEPFAMEAKYFVESRLLNRDVHVMLEGVDKYNNFYGTVKHPAGNISEELLKVGLSKVVDWSAKFTQDPELLYKAERIAKEKRLRMWQNYVAPARSATIASAAEFVGKVSEVISGDFLVIKDFAVPPMEHRVALSSIRAPKIGRRDEKDEPWAFEAREFLRTRLIGRKVTVGIDYIRQLPNSTAETERVFASVLEGNNNVAVALVANGLASVMKHRQDDQDRSLYYDDLIQAEAAATRDKKGIHSDKPPAPRHVNDISTQAALAQAKQMFTFLQRAGRLQGTVQHVVNGARVKVYIPKQSCIISLALAGVKCPSTGRKEGDQGEPYGEEALQFTKERCLQHDVEVEVLAQDKIGTMIGKVYLYKRDLSALLLQEGLARTTGRDLTNEMEQAELSAQQARLRTWERYDAELEAARAAEAAAEVVEHASQEMSMVTVVEMLSPVSFYVHAAGVDKQIELLTDRLANAKLDGSKSDFSPKVGEACVAKFSADNQWYRAQVEARKADSFLVLFRDFGNREEVKLKDLRPIPSSVPSFQQIPPQAVEYKLAYVKVPSADEENMAEATGFMQNLLGACEGVLSAKTEFFERSGRHHVTLVDNSTGENVAALLLRNGLAKLERRRQDTPGLKEEQERARNAHLGIWRYGDAVDSDEDDRSFAQDVAQARAKVKGGK
mmetsp:Transcript_2017/g.6126  ORF Transcript_2017/g.6126 Transcript_2017/m.6126 type:complete len:896 (-) Transcript_2017:3840-6527(-)